MLQGHRRPALLLLFLLFGTSCPQAKGQRESPPSPGCSQQERTCQDTEHHVADAVGNPCSQYQHLPPSACGIYDTAFFKANVSCCACGGGAPAGPACPLSADSAVPAADGTCSCEVSTQCFKGNSHGCPDQAEKSFSQDCKDCRCARRGSAPNANGQACINGVEQTSFKNTKEALVAYGVMTQLEDIVSNAARSVGALVGLWRSSHDRFSNNMLRREKLMDFSVLRNWAVLLLDAVTRNTQLQSCGIHVVATGEAVYMESGGCEDPQNATFVTGVNDFGGVTSYRMKQTHDCLAPLVGVPHCDWSKAFIDRSSGQDIPVVHYNRSGVLEYGYGKLDVRAEAWWGVALYSSGWLSGHPTNEIFVIPAWGSFTRRSLSCGVGALLRDATSKREDHSEELMLKCDIDSAWLSRFSKTLVGRGARLTVFSVRKELLATSHGSIEMEAGLVPKLWDVTEFTDPVISMVSAQILGDFAKNKDYPRWQDFDIEWKEMKASVTVYARFYSTMFMVYVDPAHCKRGQYMPVNNTDEVSECVPCPPGRSSPKMLAVGEICEACPGGAFSDGFGKTICLTCETGFFQDTDNSTECNQCPDNTTSLPGAKNSSECYCKPNYWVPSGNPGEACIPCSLGMECKGNVTRPYAQPGYYSLTPQVALKCVDLMESESNPCEGGNINHPQTFCKEGYEGTGCSRCAAGFYRFGRNCYECVQGDFMLRCYWVMLLFTFYSVRVVVNSRYKAFYIFLSFLQVFSIQGAFPLGWTPAIKHTMRIVAVANLQVDLLMPSCEKQWPITSQYLEYMGMPWLFMLMDWCHILTVRLVQRLYGTFKMSRSVSKSSPQSPPDNSPEDAKEVEDCEGSTPTSQELRRDSSTSPSERPLPLYSHTAWKNWRQRTSERSATVVFELLEGKTKKDIFLDFISKSLTNMRLMYLPLAGKTLDMLFCTHVRCPEAVDLPARLSADPELICWQGLHLQFMPAVIVGGLVFVIGTPLSYIIILYRGYKNNLLFSVPHLRRFGILYSRFEPEYFYWELVILLRRLLTVVIKTSLNIRTAEYQSDQLGGYIGNFQAGLLAFVMGLSLFCHSYARPFCNPFLDFGDAVYLGVASMSCIIGICFSAARNDTEELVLETLFFLNFGVAILTTVWLLWTDLEHVHHSVRKFRKSVFARMGLEKMARTIQTQVELLVRKGSCVRLEERLRGVDCTVMSAAPLLGMALKAALAQSMLEHLHHRGVHPQQVEVTLEIEEARVIFMVEAPPGVPSKEVVAYMEEHSHEDAAHRLLKTLVRALGSDDLGDMVVAPESVPVTPASPPRGSSVARVHV